MLKDTIDGLMVVIRNYGGKSDGKKVNLGNPGNNFSVKEIVEIVLPLWESHPLRKAMTIPLSEIVEEPRINFYGKGYQDAIIRTHSIRKMQETFGFQTKIDMKKIFKEVY
jgi:UDP-4-amino-4-deoxy-L-arabinose formyltransferase/UDP-glucuronic acid dehydrogenase (UDP-4-keto-hexauronic acid decarboxylating)